MHTKKSKSTIFVRNLNANFAGLLDRKIAGNNIILLRDKRSFNSFFKLFCSFLFLLIACNTATAFDLTVQKRGNGTVTADKLTQDSTMISFVPNDFEIIEQSNPPNAYLYKAPNEHRLTRPAGLQATAIFYKIPIDIRNYFTMDYDMRWDYPSSSSDLTGIPSPADGIVFIFHQILDLNRFRLPPNDPDYIDIGKNGAIGQLIPNSCRIEGDIWINPQWEYNDPLYDHMAIMTGGKPLHDLNDVGHIAYLQNGIKKIDMRVWYKVRIVGYFDNDNFDDLNNGYNLEVWMVEEKEPKKGYQLKLKRHFEKRTDFLGNGLDPRFNTRWYEVLWGFTSATGGSYSDQRVRLNTIVYHDSATVAVEATPAECYHFRHWVDTAGNILSQIAQKDTITIKSDSIIIAVFESDGFNLEIQAAPEEGGIVQKKNADFGCDEIIEAIPNDCYTFLYWKNNRDSIVSTKRIDTVSLVSDSVLIAHFLMDSLTLTLLVNPPEAATVLPSDEERYPCNEMAPYEVVPNKCYSFINWTNGNGEVVSENLADSIIMNTDHTLTANFRADSLELIVEAYPPNGGLVRGNGRFMCDAPAQYSAEPYDCFTFSHWSYSTADGDTVTTETSDTIIMDKDYRLVAVFIPDTFNLKLTAEPAAGGTVEGAGNYGCQDIVGYSAIPNACWQFSHWTDDNGGDTVVSRTALSNIVMDTNHAFTAHFILDTFALTLKVNPAGAGTVTGAGDYPCGTVAEYVTTPNTCYTFVNWTDDDTGDTLSLNLSDTVTMFRVRNLTANYTLDTFTLTLTVNPAGAGTVSGEGDYPCGTAVEYSATPNECYSFVNWTDANTNEVVSTNPIVMSEDRELVANFTSFLYNVALSASFTQAGANQTYSIGDVPPKLLFSLQTDAPASELSKVTELSINFDYNNVFARIKQINFLDLKGWTVKGTPTNTVVSPQISNYSFTIEGDGLSFTNNINAFEVEMEVALPNSQMIEQIQPEYYQLSISPEITMVNAECLTNTTNTTEASVNPFCAIGFRVLDMSDINFGLTLQGNEINYSIGFDCEATLAFTNSLGQAVYVPVSGAIAKGNYKLDINNVDLPSGNYFCELIINNLYRKVVGLYIAK